MREYISVIVDEMSRKGDQAPGDGRGPSQNKVGISFGGLKRSLYKRIVKDGRCLFCKKDQVDMARGRSCC